MHAYTSTADVPLHPSKAEGFGMPVPLIYVHAYTSTADVLLHPSKAEGFGMPVLEAQAYLGRASKCGPDLIWWLGLTWLVSGWFNLT